MSSVVAQFDPSVSNTASFTAPQGSANGALVFFNESQNSLTLGFADGSNMYLPAWYHRHKCGATGSVNVSWGIHTTLMSGSPPMSLMIVEAFAQGEHFPADGPLVRQTNGSTNSTVAGTSLVNTGNPPGTTDIIQIQPSDAASPTWLADNSGNLTIKGDNVGTLTTLLQTIAGASPTVKLAAAGIIAEVLGNLKVDGTSTLDNGAITTDGLGTLYTSGVMQAHGHMVANLVLPESGNDYAIDVATGHKIALQVNNTDIVDINGTGLAVTGTNKVTSDNFSSIANGDVINITDASGAVIAAFQNQISSANPLGASGGLSVNKLFFNIGAIKDINKGSFSASGTYNHGLSGTPTIVLLCPSLSGSTWTFSAYTFTSTQFSATINSANNTNWMAYR